jgi:phage gp36-like protein
MRYCTLDDLTLAIPVRTLTQLSNDTSPATEPNQEVVERAVAHAEEVIDGYLRSRYVLPLKEVPTVVRELTVNIARHCLYARRPEGKDDLPPAVVRSYKAAMDMLAAIQKGTLTIGVEATQAAQAEPGKMRSNGAGKRIFNDHMLDKY